MKLPDFFIIGAAKAGTTSVHAVLSQHPQVFMPKNKEPEFFARDDRYGDGLASYATNFSEARTDQLVGEASTIYSLSPFFPNTAARIVSARPDAKIIYILREPVSRAYSFYLQLIKSYQRATKDTQIHRRFEDFVLPDRHAMASPRNLCFSPANAHLPDAPELCLAGSDYVMQIERYLEYFDRSQMLFLLFEDLARAPNRFYQEITDFLGIAPMEPGISEKKVVPQNVSQQGFQKIEFYLAIAELRDRMGLAWSLRKALPKNVRTVARAWLLQQSADKISNSPPPMLPETRKQLEARFYVQTAELSTITKLDLSAWK
jgi:hypothetical protein